MKYFDYLIIKVIMLIVKTGGNTGNVKKQINTTDDPITRL